MAMVFIKEKYKPTKLSLFDIYIDFKNTKS